MKLSSISTVLLSVSAAIAASRNSAGKWPDTPFTVSGRDIKSASGANIVFAGVSWPGAAETMLPEGLQYSSIAKIVGFVKGLGMNVVRLTYATEMIDDHFAKSPDQTLEGTLNKALGPTNGKKILQAIMKHNPSFTAHTTRLEVFDAVAAELAKQQIWVHLDNHVSKAEWCCATQDGNAWFGDRYFDIHNWVRGLGFMADHAKSWTGLSSMSLRNELRQGDNKLPYTWDAWLDNVIPAANAIHANNSSPLIFFSGLEESRDDSFFVQRQSSKAGTFEPETYPFREKIVYEAHRYKEHANSCDEIKDPLYKDAYCAMNLKDGKCPNHGPMVLSEFGFEVQDGSYELFYAQCIKDFITSQPGGPGGWMQWVLAGSYYIRQGTQDKDEEFGLLNHDWSGWRNLTVINSYVKSFLKETLK